MDLQSALICGLVFVVSAVILLLISAFGIKEKSYEEALAEQKKLTSGLLGTGQKPKPKEKKQKKAGKKVKEKTVTNVEAETVEEVDNSETVVSENTSDEQPHSKLHVEFEPDPAVIEPPVSKVKSYLLLTFFIIISRQRLILFIHSILMFPSFYLVKTAVVIVYLLYVVDIKGTSKFFLKLKNIWRLYILFFF